MKFSDRFAKLKSLKSTWVAAAFLAGGVFVAGTPAAHAQHVSAYVGFGTPAYVEPAPVYADPGPVYVVPPRRFYGDRDDRRWDYDRDRYMGWRAHEWREHEWREHEMREHEWREHEEHEHGDWR